MSHWIFFLSLERLRQSSLLSQAMNSAAIQQAFSINSAEMSIALVETLLHSNFHHSKEEITWNCRRRHDRGWVWVTRIQAALVAPQTQHVQMHGVHQYRQSQMTDQPSTLNAYHFYPTWNRTQTTTRSRCGSGSMKSHAWIRWLNTMIQWLQMRTTKRQRRELGCWRQQRKFGPNLLIPSPALYRCTLATWMNPSPPPTYCHWNRPCPCEKALLMNGLKVKGRKIKVNKAPHKKFRHSVTWWQIYEACAFVNSAKAMMDDAQSMPPHPLINPIHFVILESTAWVCTWSTSHHVRSPRSDLQICYSKKKERKKRAAEERSIALQRKLATDPYAVNLHSQKCHELLQYKPLEEYLGEMD